MATAKANAPYLQQHNFALKQKGKVAKEKAGTSTTSLTIKEAMEAPWVWSEEAALAVWSWSFSNIVVNSFQT